MTENQDLQFAYKVTGIFIIGACNEHIFSLGFDSSIPVPKDSMIQFDILLPRNLKIFNSPGFSNKTDIVNMLEVTKDDILENYPYVTISVWYAGANKPLELKK
jgi:hypothetical protein